MSSLYQRRYNPDVLDCLANLSSDEVFTPPDVANRMLDLLPQELFSNPETTFLDPACKSGVFLREIAKRLIVGLESLIPDVEERLEHIYHNQLFGIAITELTSLMSRRTLYYTKYPQTKFSVSQFDNPEGNIIYKNLDHTWVGDKCFYCGTSRGEFDREDGLEKHAYNFIHTEQPEEIFKMKFDVIIGNPPYQLDDGGAGASAKPIYNLFIEQAKKLNPNYLVMIIPSRWFAGGKGLDKFRANMLQDGKLSDLVDYVNAKDIFPGTSIGGGVCYFKWDKHFRGMCSFTNIHDGQKSTQPRDLTEFDVFIRYNEGINVIHKVQAQDKTYLSSLVSSRNPFGFPSSARGDRNPIKGSVRLHSSAGIGYIQSSEVQTNIELADSYKVMISKLTSEHAGEPNKDGQFRVLSTCKILEPREICTDSYLVLGKFDNLVSAQHLLGYLQSKFCRFLLLMAVTSINLSKEKFQFVPTQDFSKPWTDEELYEKYDLSENEIEFIESLIRPMDLEE